MVTQISPTVAQLPYSVAAADFNGDRYPDIVVGAEGQQEMSILLNNKNGTFTTTEFNNPGAGVYPTNFAVGDFIHRLQPGRLRVRRRG